MEPHRNGRQRGSIRIGLAVDIIRKEDQRSNKKTRGIVQEILTSSLSHPHGIKVRLKGGQVGRVAEIIGDDHPRDTGKDP
ncbi:MAG: YwbE family protein [Methanoregula sp.]|nr:YwbE family protein [Methanoregula sp.]